MSYQSDIIDALEADGTVSGLVGTRIYADFADNRAAAPYIVYTVVTTGGETLHNGTRDIEFPQIQFNCWAKTKTGAIALAGAVKDALEAQSIAGSSGVTLVFNDQQGRYEPTPKLYGEFIEFRAACAPN